MLVLNKLENLGVIDLHYWDNYVIDLEKNDIKDFKSFIRDREVLETEDNIKFSVCFEYGKPNRNIYYNDEYEEPVLTEEFFVRYNNRNFSSFFTKTELYFATFKNKGVEIVTYDFVDPKGGYSDQYQKIRPLSKEEIKFLFDFAKAKDSKNVENIKKYFKRYKDKIYIGGYYANR